jgi:hypothetical protein
MVLMQEVPALSADVNDTKRELLCKAIGEAVVRCAENA